MQCSVVEYCLQTDAVVERKKAQNHFLLKQKSIPMKINKQKDLPI